LLCFILVSSVSSVAAQTVQVETNGRLFRVVSTLPYGVMNSHPDGLPIAIESERLPGRLTEQLPPGFIPAHLRTRASDDGAADPR
jgi:hypothetical protein